MISPLLLALLTYFSIRFIFHAVGNSVGRDLLVSSIEQGIGTTFIQCMVSAGFYFRKMLYPFPMNFAISTTSSMYYLVPFAVITLLAAFCFYFRRDLRFSIALTAAALVPPLYVAVSGIAWTPYAERYLYMPMVGFALFASSALGRYLQRIPSVFLLCVILLLGIPTALRVKTWTDPVAFWQDTVDKSPHFGTPHLLLAAELISAGRLDEAGEHLLRARELGIKKTKELAYARAVQTALLDARKRNAGSYQPKGQL